MIATEFLLNKILLYVLKFYIFIKKKKANLKLHKQKKRKRKKLNT